MSSLKRIYYNLSARQRYYNRLNRDYKRNNRKRSNHPENLNLWERKYFSQNGEDGIIEEIFKRIGILIHYYVEFGAGDGSECNTRYLSEKFGFSGLLMDAYNSSIEINLRREFVTRENVESLFRKYKVPTEFDLLSIDIDGNDYYVWEAIRNFTPRVVVIEYNSSVPPNKSKTIPYDPNFKWKGTDYFGASLLALKKLGERKGYTLVCCDNLRVNAFFVRSNLVNFPVRSYRRIYRKPRYAGVFGHGWPKDVRKMVEV